MALQASAPIVPIALIGTDVAQPVGTIVPGFRSKIEIHFGAPIGMGRWASNRRTRRARTELTEEVMQSIAALSGQERSGLSQRSHYVPEPTLV